MTETAGIFGEVEIDVAPPSASEVLAVVVKALRATATDPRRILVAAALLIEDDELAQRILPLLARVERPEADAFARVTRDLTMAIARGAYRTVSHLASDRSWDDLAMSERASLAAWVTHIFSHPEEASAAQSYFAYISTPSDMPREAVWVMQALSPTGCEQFWAAVRAVDNI